MRCSRGRFPVWRDMWRPSPRASWPASTRPCWRWAKCRARCRARPRWDRYAITSPGPIPRIISPPILPSICCRRSTKTRATNCAMIRKRATWKFAAARSRPWRSTGWSGHSMSELEAQIDRYVRELERRGVSGHTVRAYAADLAQFLEYLSPPESAPPEPQAIDVLTLREWLVGLYGQNLATVTIRRKLAAVRGLFGFLRREGLVKANVGRLVSTPKAPKRVPEVMTAVRANALVDGVGTGEPERPFPARDRAIFELLYGCGVRVSELAGIDLGDIDQIGRWLRVRGKGRKERQVPVPGKAAEALERYRSEEHTSELQSLRHLV